MKWILSVKGKDAESERRLSEELKGILSRLQEQRAWEGLGSGQEIEARPVSEGGELGQMVFVDSRFPGADESLRDFLASVPRKGRAIFLIAPETASVSPLFLQRKVDDVLIAPFRSMELLGKVRHCQQILMWEEVNRLNVSLGGTIQHLQQDLSLAERLQKGRLPRRFPDVRGLKVTSRYLAGMKAGGDHFDLAESASREHLSMVLTDSSTYGLSSAILSALMRVSMKLSSDELRSSRETVRKIHEEIALTLGEKDRLSLFYGILSRKDYRLRFVNLGSSLAFYAPFGGHFESLPIQGSALTSKGGLPEITEGEVSVSANGRMVLVSDGFVEASGGEAALRKLLDEFRAKEANDCVNELVYRVKKEFTEDDDLPAQDCTAVVFDVDSRLIRAV